MQKTIMNISDETLYKVLGAELKNSTVIDTKMQQAYEMIREKSRTKNNGTNNGVMENKSAKTVKMKKDDTTCHKSGNIVWHRILITLGSMAAILCITCIFCVMNPVMAREIPFLGSIFGKIADVYTFGKLPEEGTVNLLVEEETGFVKDGVVVSEEDTGAVYGDEIAVENDLVSTDGGITISIMEEYASNQAVYIGVKVENEQAFPEMVATIDKGQQFIKARTLEDYSFNPGQRKDRRYIEGKFVDEHTFIGSIRIDYDNLGWQIEEADAAADIPESYTMELEITEIASTLKDVDVPEEFDISNEEFEQMTEEEQTAYFNSLPKAWYGIEYQSWHQAGTWHFTIPVNRTDENIRSIVVNQYNGAGVGVENIEISSMEMTVHTVMPDEAALCIVVFDADGRQIVNQNSSNAGFAMLTNGHDISTVSIYFCDMDTYFELEETNQGTDLAEEAVEKIAQYKVTVPISAITE
ncbi:MAG: hypothetical protein K2O65_03320 [Lachnospiraceae bacterium]|nr:hypothetical protein [Lachnospiraceae bacterium]